MEILFWLLPAVAVTLAAMAWVGWWGRESRSTVTGADREAAARRLGEALSRQQASRPGYAVERRTPERSSGVAVRPSKVRPVIVPGTDVNATDDAPAVSATEQAARDRRAS